MSRRDPHSYADFEQGRIRSMDLDLQVDFSARVIAGRAVYRLAGATGGPLDLDTRDLTIRGAAAGGEALAFDLAEADPVLGSRLRVRLPEGTEAMRITLAGDWSLVLWGEGRGWTLTETVESP